MLRFHWTLRVECAERGSVRAWCFCPSSDAVSFSSLFYLLCYWTLVCIPPAVPSLSYLPASVAARGERVDGAAQRGGFDSLPRRGGAGKRWGLAPFAAGYQQFGGSSEPPQSSAVCRSGTLPGERWCTVTINHPDRSSCFFAASTSVMHFFRPVWRWMGSCETLN